MHVRHFLLAAAVAAATLLGTASPAAASCLFDDRPMEARVAEASTVFVGTVQATEHNDTSAEVAITEIWKGADNLRTVIVQGGSGEAGTVTSVDRSFTVGTTYLFLPQPEGNVFLDNACSATREWTPDLAAARPDDATVVADGPDGGGDDGGADGAAEDGGLPAAVPVAVALVALSAAGAAAWFAKDRAGRGF